MFSKSVDLFNSKKEDRPDTENEGEKWGWGVVWGSAA